MRLAYRELRESITIACGGVTAILTAGILLHLGREVLTTGMSRWLWMGLYICGAALSALYGALTFASDRERGTHHFIMALPVSASQVFVSKVLISASQVLILYIAFYCLSPDLHSESQFWLFFLAYGLTGMFAVILQNTVHAWVVGLVFSVAFLVGITSIPMPDLWQASIQSGSGWLILIIAVIVSYRTFTCLWR